MQATGETVEGRVSARVLVVGDVDSPIGELARALPQHYACRVVGYDRVVARDIHLAHLVVLGHWNAQERAPHLRELLERSRHKTVIAVTQPTEISGQTEPHAAAALRRLARAVIAMHPETEQRLRLLSCPTHLVTSPVDAVNVLDQLIADQRTLSYGISWAIAAERATVRGDLRGAVQLWQRILDNDPESPTAHACLAKLWWQLDQPITAIGFQRRALVLGDHDPVAVGTTSSLLEAQGQTEFAARIMRDFATRHPETAAVATEAHQN